VRFFQWTDRQEKKGLWPPLWPVNWNSLVLSSGYNLIISRETDRQTGLTLLSIAIGSCHSLTVDNYLVARLGDGYKRTTQSHSDPPKKNRQRSPIFVCSWQCRYLPNYSRNRISTQKFIIGKSSLFYPPSPS
jgi:hypothetical protein